MYRTIIYQGETETALLKRLKEIKDRRETIIKFTIESYEGEVKDDK